MGAAELLDAAQKMAWKIKNGELSIKVLMKKLFLNNLYPSSGSVPYVDLIIRTGGMKEF